MQLRLLLFPLLWAVPCACTSTSNHDDATGGTATQQSSAPDEHAAQVDPAQQGGSEAGRMEIGAGDATVGAEDSATRAALPAAAARQDPSAQAPGSLTQDATRFEALRQQGAFLSQKSIEEGDAALARGDLAGALKAYSAALELDTTSAVAREKKRKVDALLGDKFSEAVSFMKDATDIELVRRAQARMAAEDARVRGKNALLQGDWETAIEQYRQAEMILRYNPLISTQDISHNIVAGELKAAIRLGDEARLNAERKAQDLAAEARERHEREEAQHREEILHELYTQANSAFLNENFAQAEALSAQILLEDPGNQAATELATIARGARHSKIATQNREDFREQWIRTIEGVDTLGVLQTEPIVFNDLKRWAEVDRRKPLEFSLLDTTGSQDKQAILDRLDQVRIAPKFLGADGGGSSLDDIAGFLQINTGLNFVISPKVKTDLDEEQRTIKLDLPSRSVRKVLDLIAETHDNLKWKIEDGVVKFVTKEETKGGQVLRTYEVRDLIHPIRDFPGREMNVSPSGGVQTPEEDKTVREANVITGESLTSLIHDSIAPGSWDEDPRNAVRISTNGTMVVNQKPEVHEQIQRLLEDLREATGIMVDIQARFLNVEDNFLEDIGVDFRGLGQPGLGTNAFFNDFGDASTQQDLGREIGQNNDLGAFYDRGGRENLRARVEELYDTSLGDSNILTGSGGLSFQWTYLNDMQLQLILRAVSKSVRVELVTSPRITVHNTARGNLSVLNQVAYVQDFNVEIAQGASIADPIVNVVQDGVVLDVRPTVSADRRFITLELRPTIANLRRPIREVVTTLGSQNSVTIQLPEVQLQKVRTSIPMPDGGTVLLGGLKVSDKQDNASGVPILNRIPIVSFFFNRKGQYVSNRKLLILLKAAIVIPQEHEPTPAQVNPSTTRPRKP